MFTQLTIQQAKVIFDDLKSHGKDTVLRRYQDVLGLNMVSAEALFNLTHDNTKDCG